VQDFAEPDQISPMERIFGGLTFIRIPLLRLSLCLGVTTADLDEPG